MESCPLTPCDVPLIVGPLDEAEEKGRKLVKCFNSKSRNRKAPELWEKSAGQAPELWRPVVSLWMKS